MTTQKNKYVSTSFGCILLKIGFIKHNSCEQTKQNKAKHDEKTNKQSPNFI